MYGATDASEMNVKPRNLLKTASFIYNIRPQLCIKRYLDVLITS